MRVRRLYLFRIVIVILFVYILYSWKTTELTELKAFEEAKDDELWNLPWTRLSKDLVTQEELAMPLAYSIVVYTDLKQVLLLLRAIYRQHNYYCIHLDKKAPPKLHLTLQRWIVQLPHVFLMSQPVNVVHSTITALEADMLCMRELLSRAKDWLYFINLTGQEFPRKTNLEMVRILKLLNGSNLIRRDPFPLDRIWKRIFFSPPFNMTLWKGAVHIIAVRGFVEYAIHDARARALYQYILNTHIPDETFFSTLNHNKHLQVPGGYTGDELTGPAYPYINRIKTWINDWGNEWNDHHCHGRYVRLVCIWGTDDFPILTNESDPNLFINKFIVSINGKLLLKIDQWFLNRQQNIYANPKMADLSFYQNLPQIKMHF